MSRTVTTPQTLALSYGTSRGRDTMGYTIVRLRDSDTGKLFRCMGGGYDMVGTVLGQWLTEVHQDALRELAARAFYRFTPAGTERHDEPAALYGLAAYVDEAGTVTRVSIDGACGVESVLRVAKAAGVQLQRLHKKGNTTGWLVVEDDAPAV